MVYKDDVSDLREELEFLDEDVSYRAGEIRGILADVGVQALTKDFEVCIADIRYAMKELKHKIAEIETKNEGDWAWVQEEQ